MKFSNYEGELPLVRKNQVDALLAQITVILPELVNLDAEDRQKVIKFTNRFYRFVDECYDAIQRKPDFLPRYLDPAEITKKYSSLKNMRMLRDSLRELTSGVEQTTMVLEEEMFRRMLEYYHIIQNAKSTNEPGVVELQERLKKHFINKRGKEGSLEELIDEGIDDDDENGIPVSDPKI